MASLCASLNVFLAMFSILPRNVESYNAQLLTADIDIRSVDFNASKPGKISLSGGNEKQLVEKGLTVAKVDPDLTKLTDFMTFDTHTDKGAIKFKNYIKKQLKHGDIIVGGNSDDVETGLKNHSRFFRSEGLDFTSLQFRGKVAFVFQKGFPKKTILISDVQHYPYPNGRDPDPLDVRLSITRPSVRANPRSYSFVRF